MYLTRKEKNTALSQRNPAQEKKEKEVIPMAGFHWEEFYRIFKEKLEKMTDCIVEPYVPSGENRFPCVEARLIENPGSGYDLEGGEGACSPLIEVRVYCGSTLGDTACCRVSEAARNLMLSYGFQCRNGPGKAEEQSPGVVRWAGRYQRIFGNSEELEQYE